MKPPPFSDGSGLQATWVNINFSFGFFSERLNTRNLLRRKNMVLDDYNCVLCNLACEETSFHLFFECPFSQACWPSIPIIWNTNLSALDMILQAREDFSIQSLGRQLSQPVGSSGLQEMELYLTMVKSTSTIGREISMPNLDWCAPKPRQQNNLPLVPGEIALPNALFFSCFGPSSLVFLL